MNVVFATVLLWVSIYLPEMHNLDYTVEVVVEDRGEALCQLKYNSMTGQWFDYCPDTLYFYAPTNVNQIALMYHHVDEREFVQIDRWDDVEVLWTPIRPDGDRNYFGYRNRYAAGDMDKFAIQLWYVNGKTEMIPFRQVCTGYCDWQ